MINNRQAGRRRGRNNPRPNNGGGGHRGNGDSGNRIDNRARGNAVQLLEKYRNMARDAQLAGDRVNAEYYLQFADHYFRVLADNRARQEEQQARFRRPESSDGEEYDSADEGDGTALDDGDDGYGPMGDEPAHEVRRRDERGSRPPRGDRPERFERPERSERPARGPRPERPERAETPPAPEPRDEPAFDAAILPPAISRAEPANEDGPAEAAPPAPRRRGRPRKAQAAE